MEAAWYRFHDSALASIVEPVDRTALETLFLLYDERSRSLEAYRKRRFVLGSQGQPTLNPIARMLAPLTAQIHQLERAFGVTPRARLALGLKVGAVRKTLEDLGSELDEQDEPDPRIRHA